MSALSNLRNSFDSKAAGDEMYAWIRDWFPIPRSLTGHGIREQFRRMGEIISLTLTETPSGAAAFDWTVPKEWNVREAYIADATGKRIVDYAQNNLHLLAYSMPVRERMPLEKLKEHCITLPEQPELIPYRTSYYKERWAFCLPHRLLESLPQGEYNVVIDATLGDGHLTYAECLIPGTTEEEVLISAHACHPSLANDNLSGLAVATWLARALQDKGEGNGAGSPSYGLRFTYRFVFAPGTAGAIVWLSRNQDRAHLIRHGLVLALIGDAAPKTYKRSRRGDASTDRAMQYVLEHRGQPHEILPFIPYGYDERQYNSPGFNLPVGCFMRSRPGEFPEYHTSADSLDFVRAEFLADSLATLLQVFEILEEDRYCLNLKPYCEPQLGKRGLYTSFGSSQETRDFELAMLWVLNYSDGRHCLLDIAHQSGKPFELIVKAAEALLRTDLLREAHPGELVPSVSG